MPLKVIYNRYKDEISIRANDDEIRQNYDDRLKSF